MKQHLLQVCRGMDQSIIDRAIDDWRERFRACVPENVNILSNCYVMINVCLTSWQETFHILSLCQIWYDFQMRNMQQI